MKYLIYLISLIAAVCITSCDPTAKGESKNSDETPDKEEEVAESVSDLDRLNLPEGFSINVWADDVENARSMAMSPTGVLFVGSRSEGKVYALKDTDGDYKADKKYTLAKGLNMPNGVAFRNGSLYVAEVSKLWRFDNIEQNLDNPPQ
ncbi:MAG: sorbosone dehydrogenase family protein, partial [Cyclobacteriaceae bacterium]